MTYLIKTTNVYRVPTVQDALSLRKELETKGGELTSFKYATKYIKAKGEIIEEYQLVTATLQFNDEKEPESNIRETYGMEGTFVGTPIEKISGTDYYKEVQS